MNFFDVRAFVQSRVSTRTCEACRDPRIGNSARRSKVFVDPGAKRAYRSAREVRPKGTRHTRLTELPALRITVSRKNRACSITCSSKLSSRTITRSGLASRDISCTARNESVALGCLSGIFP